MYKILTKEEMQIKRSKVLKEVAPTMRAVCKENASKGLIGYAKVLINASYIPYNYKFIEGSLPEGMEPEEVVRPLNEGKEIDCYYVLKWMDDKTEAAYKDVIQPIAIRK